MDDWKPEAEQKIWVETAVCRYQQARTDGLCHEGALAVTLVGVEKIADEWLMRLYLENIVARKHRAD